MALDGKCSKVTSSKQISVLLQCSGFKRFASQFWGIAKMGQISILEMQTWNTDCIFNGSFLVLKFKAILLKAIGFHSGFLIKIETWDKRSEVKTHHSKNIERKYKFGSDLVFNNSRKFFSSVPKGFNFQL